MNEEAMAKRLTQLEALVLSNRAGAQQEVVRGRLDWIGLMSELTGFSNLQGDIRASLEEMKQFLLGLQNGQTVSIIGWHLEAWKGGLNVCLQVLQNGDEREDDSGIERKEVRSVCLLESRLFDVDWPLNLQSATRPNIGRQLSGVASKSQIDKLVRVFMDRISKVEEQLSAVSPPPPHP